MDRKELTYAVFYPARSYKSTCDEIKCDLQSYLKVKNFPQPELSQQSKKDEFLSLIKDATIDVMMAWYGGQVENGNVAGSSLELVQSLSELDWYQIANSKMKIVGRSDITFLLCRLMQYGVSCYYGPNYSSLSDDFKGDVSISLAKKNIEITKKYLELALTSDEKYVIDFKADDIACGSEPWIFNKGQCTGRLIGGNLDTLAQMLQGCDEVVFCFGAEDVLLIESIDPKYSWNKGKGIHGDFCEKLNILKKSGVFDCVGGIILGKSKEPRVFDTDKGYFFDQVSNEIEKEYLYAAIEKYVHRDIPVLANISCSHTSPMVTLPLERTVMLDADKATLTIFSK